MVLYPKWTPTHQREEELLDTETITGVMLLKINLIEGTWRMVVSVSSWISRSSDMLPTISQSFS